jgi:hypothetical protein
MRRNVILLLFFALIAGQVKGQFYNGLQMQFGKNRIQYAKGEVLESDFFYSFYRFNRFDVYFQPNGQELAEYVGEKAFTEIGRLENYFEYSLSKRIIFLVYNKLSDFRQSNIGLVSGREETNIGGVTQILDNKVFLYFNGDHDDLDQQLRAAICEVIMGEMIYGGSVRDRVASSTLLNVPEWYQKGLVAYLSKGWDIETENRVKDGILSGRFERFSKLTGEEAAFAGHSIWYYIAQTYGDAIIPTILYFTKINRNTSAGFMNVLGMSLKSLSYEWLYFFRQRYGEEAHTGDPPPPSSIKLKNKKGVEYIESSISPDGSKIAFVRLEKGQAKVFLYEEGRSRAKKIFKIGEKLDQIQDKTFPSLAWNPSGQALAMIREEKGKIIFSVYPLTTRKWEDQEIKLFEKIIDFSFSYDGLSIVLSGVMNGQTDIFVHNLAANTNERITDDLADDFHPRFADGGKQIVFSSNRVNNSLEAEKESSERMPSNDLFIYDYENKSDELIRLAGNRFFDRLEPSPAENKQFYFLGDDSGIRNRYVARYDSAIAFIDTTTHYRFFSRTFPVTSYNRNILGFDANKSGEDISQLMFYNNRYLINRQSSFDQNRVSGELPRTSFSVQKEKRIIREDSLELQRERDLINRSLEVRRVSALGRGDSLKAYEDQIDVNNYVFEEEKKLIKERLIKKDPLSSPGSDPLTGRKFELPSIRIYEPAFYVNYLASLIDFSFLNASYQPFTGGAVYYNPGFNMLFKIGTQDLFEDYKITGGFRFGGDFDSNEYLISFQNLKKRLDREIIYHRQSYRSTTVDYTSLLKTSSQSIYYVLKYPLSQVAAFKGTMSFRHDRNVFLATDQRNLMRDNIVKYWGGAKLEYIFDNTMQPGLNLYNGTRLKVFGEYFQQVNGDYSDVFIIGGDVRHYLPIHRTLIWANRFAASTSFGSGRLIYYLGGVDNWTNFSRDVQTFDYSVPIDTTQTFVFQTLATNMRGFTQNIRNGNSFALINSEIRWPVFRYFANRPINSDFLSNFQIVGFFDVGTAWTGPNPYDKRNHLNREVIKNGPITVEIEKGNEPLVAGFGTGVRSRLLGYFIRLDWAWGIENYVLLPRIFYFSLSLDF